MPPEAAAEGGEHPEMVIGSHLYYQHPRLAGDLFQIDEQTWAIYGFIPVDGEVILGTFDDPDTARAALDLLAAAENRDERA